SAWAALRLRVGAVWCLFGVVGRQGDQELRDAGGRRFGQGDHDARGAAGAVCAAAWDVGCVAGVASVAAGVDRRAGAALRLLPERDDDPGGGSAVDDEEPYGRPDSHRDERPPVPVRDVSADPDGDQAGRRRDGEGRQVMPGFLHEREFSRKTFVKGGGALIVGLTVAGSAGKASAAGIDPFASPGPGDPNAVDSFLIIHSDNTASLLSGRIQLGQRSTTGLMMTSAEELDMYASQMKHVPFDTGGGLPSPNTGNTGGSTSISQGGPLIRRAAAEAKQALLALASANLGVPAAQLSVDKGVVSGGGKSVTYGQL